MLNTGNSKTQFNAGVREGQTCAGGLRMRCVVLVLSASIALCWGQRADNETRKCAASCLEGPGLKSHASYRVLNGAPQFVQANAGLLLPVGHGHFLLQLCGLLFTDCHTTPYKGRALRSSHFAQPVHLTSVCHMSVFGRSWERYMCISHLCRQ